MACQPTSKRTIRYACGLGLFIALGVASLYGVQALLGERKAKSFDPNLYHLIFEKKIDFKFPAVWQFKVTKTEVSSLTFLLYSAAVQRNHKVLCAEYTLRYKEKEYSLDSGSKPVERDWPQSDDVRREAAGPSELRYAKETTGILKFTKTVPLCMDYSRYAMRIFNGNGNRFVWEDLDHIYGIFRTAIFDFDGDGVDEIVVIREDHGHVAILVFGATGNDAKHKF